MSDHSREKSRPRILLTGATGYVGGRLLRALESAGHSVRCLARDPERLERRIAPDTELAGGDVFDPASLAEVLTGVHTAYYFIHSMRSAREAIERDREAAANFSHAARHAGVRRIIYLSGLGDPDEKLSPHLCSRQEVGRILADAGLEVIEFRASIVIGSGSLSFEMIRSTVERLPLIAAPGWVWMPAQPIAVTDLIRYLLAALDLPPGPSRIFEIGGADILSYGQAMREYARLRGLRRWMIRLPTHSPRLSSIWLALTTPLHVRAGRKLIDLIRNPAVVRDHAARDAFDIQPKGVREAMAEALDNEERQFAETRWSDAMSSSGGRRSWAGVRFGGRIVDSRVATVDAPPADAFTPIRRIGGRRGWYYGNWLWRLRGFLDLVVGGVGMRRGRRDPETPHVGDTLDFWRVEEFLPDRRLRLSAEMKLPGRAWLQFEVEPNGDGSTIRQTAIFDPVGLAGLAYWYLLYPVHVLVFKGMLRGIAARGAAQPAD